MSDNNCPCKRVNCERHGNCAECKAHHSKSLIYPLTACQSEMVKNKFMNLISKTK